MDKNTALCVYLKKYHTGKEKAVPSTELEQLFSLNGRNLRRKINRLRQDGVPICSDRSGYYFASNQEEVNLFAGLSFDWTGDENIQCPDRTAVFFAFGRAAASH